MPAIKIENLSKRYIIGHQKRERYTALRDVMMHKLRGVGQRLMHPLSPNREEVDVEEFWALQAINLEIQQGDRVGIIGRNGAGKSTLLKVLSRIIEPTKGRITINGRIASLLEVGTGFHPELSGRENIFLNGAILGMSRSEIKRKFDEIVDFSGTEKFLDTPVKRYSSGMYVRLAFAVAAHLEPEILIVDEVLAVGDAEFQKKCIGKMEDVGRSGRTVLFVSHNMAAVQSLCTSAVILKGGRLIYSGSVKDAVTKYVSEVGSEITASISERRDRKGSQQFRIKSIRFIDDETNAPLSVLVSGMAVRIELDYEAKDIGAPINADVSLGFYTEAGALMFACRSSVIGVSLKARPGTGTWYLRIKKWPLNRGVYRYTVYSEGNGQVADWVTDVGTISVETGDYYGTGKVPAAMAQGVFINYEWAMKAVPE